MQIGMRVVHATSLSPGIVKGSVPDWKWQL